MPTIKPEVDIQDDRVLWIATNGKGEVILNHPHIDVQDATGGHIIFSPTQARKLAGLLLVKADLAENEMQSGRRKKLGKDRNKK